MADEDSPGTRRSSLPTVVVLLLIPIFYLASLGPIVGLKSRGVISVEATTTIYQTVYFPISYLEHETNFFDKNSVGRAYARYLQLFF